MVDLRSDAVSCEVSIMSPSYYNALMMRLIRANDAKNIEQLGSRLSDSEEAMTILRAKGYEGETLADMAKKVMPATLKHS